MSEHMSITDYNARKLYEFPTNDTQLTLELWHVNSMPYNPEHFEVYACEDVDGVFTYTNCICTIPTASIQEAYAFTNKLAQDYAKPLKDYPEAFKVIY